jgi:hypothetical protein
VAGLDVLAVGLSYGEENDREWLVYANEVWVRGKSEEDSKGPALHEKSPILR